MYYAYFKSFMIYMKSYRPVYLLQVVQSTVPEGIQTKERKKLDVEFDIPMTYGILSF